MQIILAKTGGFCFGVDRAVEMVNESVRRGNKTATLGPIIHNRHVVERFLKLFLWNYKHMNGSLWFKIIESENFFVFINFF